MDFKSYTILRGDKVEVRPKNPHSMNLYDDSILSHYMNPEWGKFETFATKHTYVLVNPEDLPEGVTEVSREDVYIRWHAFYSPKKHDKRKEKQYANNLSDSDQWFQSNLTCLLGGEITQIKRGLKQSLDRKMLAEWVLKHSQQQGKPKEEESEWTSVEDRLPEKEVKVLCLHEFSSNYFICYRTNDCLTGEEKWYNGSMPTHWMYLPKPIVTKK